MNQLPGHLGAHPSMILMCFVSLLSTSNQEQSLVFSPPRNVTCTPSSPLLCSILLCYWLHLLPSSQICPIPQPLSLHSLIPAVPAYSAPRVWSDHHSMLLLPQSLIVTVCCLLNSSLRHCQNSCPGPYPYSPLLRYFLPKDIPQPEHQPNSSGFLTHMPFWSQPGLLMMICVFLPTTS